MLLMENVTSFWKIITSFTHDLLWICACITEHHIFIFKTLYRFGLTLCPEFKKVGRKGTKGREKIYLCSKINRHDN